MARTFLVSVACPDRTGLVAAITGRLFDLGGNLGDTTFAVLGTGAEFTSLVDLPDHVEAGPLRAELGALPEAEGADVEVTPYDRPTAHGPLGQVSHVITVSGGNQPGLVARVTETFVEFGANIVHLEAGPAEAGRYAARYSVFIPDGNVDKCLATVANTAESLDLTCRWDTVTS